MATDYYELLGVSRSATEEEIKKAYRQKARELHPDTRPDDKESEERFKEVTRAYETLRDPERRRRYDTFGPEGDRAVGGDPFGAGFGGGGGLGDLFDAFFGGASAFGQQGGRGRGGRGGPPRGHDVELRLQLTFEEAVFGAHRDITVVVPVRCESCSGTGANEGTRATTCAQCQGTGEIRRVRQSILGQMVTASPCGRCGGAGEEITSPCPSCAGEGRRSEKKVLTVEVPAGVDDGSTLRLTGRGAAGPRGGPNGDLYVHLQVGRHDRFTREGQDLLHQLHLPMTQAALGAQLDFETLDGTEVLVVPAGTQTGRTFRLRGRGVPYLDGRGRGDLVLHVVVDTPTGLTKGDEELLRQLATSRGEHVASADTGLFSKIRSAFK